nr:hypothetical protein [Tanacetum cinerariifolium]
MIEEPGDQNHTPPVPQSSHLQTDDELTANEAKQVEADDQAIQTILRGLLGDIYVAVDSCNSAKEIWLRVQQMMKGQNAVNHIGYNAWQNVRYQMVHNAENVIEYNTVQNAGNQVGQNAVQNPGIQNGGDQNRLIDVPGIANQNENGNVVAAWAEGNGNANNANQIRYYNCRRVGYYARNCTLRPIRSDIEEVNANFILMANLQQASKSGTHANKALIYGSDGSAEVHQYEICYNNKIINMFAQDKKYTELLESTTEPHLVQQDDSNDISADSSMDPSEGEIEQLPDNIEETRAFYESLYNNLVIEVEKINTVNRKTKEANVKLTAELARYRGREKSFEFNQAKFDELENGYRKFVYQEQCLTKKINALPLSYSKTINTSNEGITNLNNQLSKEKSKVFHLQEERENLKNDFKIRKDELLDKVIESDKKIKQLDNILVKMSQSIQTIHMLSPNPDSFSILNTKWILVIKIPLSQASLKKQSLYIGNVLLDKHDPPSVYDSKETLQLAQESRLKMKQQDKEIKPENYVIEICLWCIDSGCSKHISRNLKLLINFVWKFMGTIQFGNDHVAAILVSHANADVDSFKKCGTSYTFDVGYRVYFVEGLGHNLFSVGLFCDSDLKVAFRRNTYFVRNQDGFDLLKGNHSINIYTINLHEMTSASPICLMGKRKSTLHKLKHVPNSKNRFHLIHMDLCVPMRIESINRKWDIEKLGAKGDIGFFISYSSTSCTYRVYNQRTKKVIEPMNVTFDELSAIDFEQCSSKSKLQGRTYGYISLGIKLTYAPSTITSQKATKRDLEILFKACMMIIWVVNRQMIQELLSLHQHL